MKISVALATWRGVEYLQAQLDSLVAQTRLPDELVAVDDASGDGTADMLDAFAARAPFEMRVLRNRTNLGYAQNFGRALSNCTGDLILPCDQDDVWFATKLERFEEWAQACPDRQIFACDAELTDGALTPTGRTKRGQIAAISLPEEAFVMGCCLGVRRTFLDAALPLPNAARAHDTWLVELADRFDLVERHGEVLQYYRQHGANTSDFLANTPDAIGTMRRMSMRAASVLRRMQSNGGLIREIESLRLQDRHITERASDIAALSGHAKFVAGQAKLSRHLGRLEARAAARSTARLTRPVAVARLWRAGGYAGIGGMTGALRDLIVASEERK